MPAVRDILARVAGTTVFSSCDLVGAYHVVPMAVHDKNKTSFATPFGSYQYCYMGFGVSDILSYNWQLAW